MTRLDEIRARLHAISPGPWVASGSYIDGPNGFAIYDEGGHKDSDAAFIAAAPEDIAYLLAQVEQLRRELQETKWRVLEDQ